VCTWRLPTAQPCNGNQPSAPYSCPTHPPPPPATLFISNATEERMTARFAPSSPILDAPRQGAPQPPPIPARCYGGDGAQQPQREQAQVCSERAHMNANIERASLCVCCVCVVVCVCALYVCEIVAPILSWPARHRDFSAKFSKPPFHHRPCCCFCKLIR